MNSALWQELAIGQICTGLASFVASSTLASFIAFFGSGLSNSYRRLMFAQSISEILKSLALFTGPWFPTSGSPQAVWAIGNEWVCQIGGFLLSMGMSGVSMYTFCLCFYYVCKSKGEMDDKAFARRFEGWMHAFIIAINLVINISALGLGTFNPSPLGNMCYLFAYPPSCMQEPGIDGENSCNPMSLSRCIIFSAINTQIIPLFCLIGGVGYLSTGETGMSSSAHDATNNENQSDAASHVGQLLGRVSRTLFDPSAFPAVMENQDEGSNNDDANAQLISDGDNDAANEEDTDNLRPQDSEIEPNTALRVTSLLRRADEVDATQSEEQNRCPLQIENREFAIQAILHLIIFCLTSLPFLILNAVLLRGSIPSSTLLRANSYLFPLGGIFNILVYSRPNVNRLRSKRPEISRILAFWMVFKAGGEDVSGAFASELSSNGQFERRVAEFVSSSNSGPSVPSMIQADVSSASNISELRNHMYSQQSQASSSSLPNTNEGVIGTSSSLDSQSMPSETISKRSDRLIEGESSKAHDSQEIDKSPTQQLYQTKQSDNERKKEMNHLWETAFDRARNMQYDD